MIVLAFAFRDKLTWNNISVWWNYEVMGAPSSGYPVNIVGSDVAQGNVAVTQNRVAYASDTSFVTLNSKGGEVNNTQLRYTKPVMKSAENRFLIFGLGEKNSGQYLCRRRCAERQILPGGRGKRLLQ